MLASEQWGSGGKVALLLHGMSGSSRSWWHIGPALAQRGYRVIAVDLPGHGRSAPEPTATPHSFCQALADSMPAPCHLAIGHSMGGSILARAIAGSFLTAHAAVYVEAPLCAPPHTRPTRTREQLRAQYTIHKMSRTEAWYRHNRPTMTDGDIDAEAQASREWDIETAVSLSWHATGPPNHAHPHIPSLIIRADPSDTISSQDAATLQQNGFTVRSMRHAGHNIWPGRTTEFLNLITNWLNDIHTNTDAGTDA